MGGLDAVGGKGERGARAVEKERMGMEMGRGRVLVGGVLLGVGGRWLAAARSRELEQRP